MFNKALFVPGGPKLDLLYVLVAIMAAVPIINGAIGILQVYETTKVGQSVMRDLRDRLYAHLQTLLLAFFTGTKTGEIQSRLANDVGGVQTVVTTTASTILANVVIVHLERRGHDHHQLAADHRGAVLTVPAFFYLTKTVGERRRKVSKSTQESLASMSAISEETLSVSGVLLAKVFGSQARDITRYREENQRLAGLFEVRQQMIGQGFDAVVQVFRPSPRRRSTWSPGCCWRTGNHITACTVVAFTTLQTRLYFPIGQLLQVSVELRSSLALFDRVFEYLDVTPDITDAPDAVDLPSAEGPLLLGGAELLCTSGTRRCRRTRCAGVSRRPTRGSWWRWWDRAEPGKTTISYLIPRLYDVTGGVDRDDGSTAAGRRRQARWPPPSGS